MTEAQISLPIGFEQVEIQRLKEQAAVKHVAGTHIITVTLNQIRPCRLCQLDLHSHRLLVTPDVELNRAPFEFPLHYFLKVRGLAFQLNIPVTGDGMIVDCEKNVPGPKNVGRWPSLDHRADEHAAVVIFQSEKLSLGRVLQLRITNREIDIFVVMPIADIL